MLQSCFQPLFLHVHTHYSAIAEKWQYCAIIGAGMQDYVSVGTQLCCMVAVHHGLVEYTSANTFTYTYHLNFKHTCTRTHVHVHQPLFPLLHNRREIFPTGTAGVQDYMYTGIHLHTCTHRHVFCLYVTTLRILCSIYTSPNYTWLPCVCMIMLQL